MSKVANKALLEKEIEIAVGSFYLYNEVDGIEHFSGSLKSHEISKSVDNPTDVLGGSQGSVVYSIPGKSNVEITVIDVLSNPVLTADKFGGTKKAVGSDAVLGMHKPQNYTVTGTTTKKITLAQTPKNSADVMLYNVKTKAPLEVAKYTVSGAEVTITDVNIHAGDILFCGGFWYDAKTTAEYSRITSESSTKTYFCMVEVPVMDENLKVIKTRKYMFDKVQLLGSVTKTGETEKKGLEEETKLKVLKAGANEYLGTILDELVED